MVNDVVGADTAGSLTVVAYHYVRDFPRTRFPRLKGLLLDRFKEQVMDLCARYEMATLGEAMKFLNGRGRPGSDLCLLTFDDGLIEHYAEVSPFLQQHKIQGLFFPATTCLEGRVATTHKIHFLMAALELADYRRAFLEGLCAISPTTPTDVSPADVQAMYPWDSPEVGALKYLANFAIDPVLRDRVVAEIFAAHFGDEAAFAADLYLTWDQLREMQQAGMIIGGHSHAHSALDGLTPDEQRRDLSHSAALLRNKLLPQPVWPFAYPFGRFNDATVDVLRDLGYSCSFTVEVGPNDARQDPFRLRRFDTNQMTRTAASPTVVQ